MNFRQILRNFYYTLRCLGFLDLPSFLKAGWAPYSSKIFELRLRASDFPITIRGKTTDIGLFHSIFVSRQYEFPELNQVDLILDLGANIGISTLWLKSEYPKSKVIAVEPEPSNFEILRKNLEDLQNVECLKAAVWPYKTSLSIEDPSALKYAFTCVEGGEGKNDTVGSVTIEELIQDVDPRLNILIKMDIEGAEKNIFESDDISWLNRINYLVIEIHPGCWKTVFSAMNKLEYDCRFRGENILFLLKN